MDENLSLGQVDALHASLKNNKELSIMYDFNDYIASWEPLRYITTKQKQQIYACLLARNIAECVRILDAIGIPRKP